MFQLSHFALVALGGAVGAMGRYAVTAFSIRLFGLDFPWGTLTVNIIGSLAMGLFVGLAARHIDVGNAARLLIATGLLGGFTTFSAFSLDTVILWERGAHGLAIVYVFGSVLLSVGALFAGLTLIKAL